jgi:hypothetical protein
VRASDSVVLRFAGSRFAGSRFAGPGWVGLRLSGLLVTGFGLTGFVDRVEPAASLWADAEQPGTEETMEAVQGLPGVAVARWDRGLHHLVGAQTTTVTGRAQVLPGLER